MARAEPSDVDVALVYPPTCDPTAPYLSVPMLAGFLRAHGKRVLPIDANVLAYDRMLTKAHLTRVRDRVRARIEELERRPSLSHVEQKIYAQLWAARGDAEGAPELVDDAVAALRDPDRFFDARAYDAAVRVVEAAQRAISAAHAPLELSFTAYRTPFSLLTPEEIAHDADPSRDPFAEVFRDLADDLAARRVPVVGISVVFPGQVQPAFSLAHALKRRLGERVHLTVGGPALTQLLVRMKCDARRLARTLGPFDSAIAYEGETALLRLLERLAAGAPATDVPNVVIKGHALCPGGTLEDLRTLPAPSFDGLALEKYFSPELVLPYDPTRGCYWGVCTFCHYGLAEKGTAPYKERAVPTMIEHLRALSTKHATPYFYFSQDSVAPKTLLKLADGLREADLRLRWATDLKPERYLTEERAQRLADAGALACALGVESAAPRVLSLIDKGAPIEAVSDVVTHLHRAGVGVEAMCFTDFPTETRREALATVSYLRKHAPKISLFILGRFDLTPGALVAQRPAEFGLKSAFTVGGDELGVAMFYEEARPAKSANHEAKIEEAIGALSEAWLLRRYPWAGSLSTAHTMLWYDRFGPSVFKDLAAKPPRAPRRSTHVLEARFDVTAIAEEVARNEAEIWRALVYDRREVTHAAYDAMTNELPHAAPSPRAFVVALGEAPRPAGRRPRHHPNAAGAVRRPTW